MQSKRFLSCLCLAALALDLSAQNLVPNPGFEAGESSPAEWRLYGRGEWNRAGQEGRRCVKVSGDGRSSSEWRSRELELRPGALYRLSCLGRVGPETSGGTAVLGAGRVNRDFRFADDWRPFRFVFCAPEAGAASVRLGQWEVKGEVFFDEVELVPAVAVHERGAAGLELGEGEAIQEGRYHFRPDFSWFGGNYHRPLARNRAGFNSNRWLFSPGAEVVYRHALNGVGQTGGRVRVYINHHTGGELTVAAGNDGERWTALATFDGAKRGGWVDLPTNLYPAAAVWVRLAQAGAGSEFQVNGYEYEAALDRALAGQAGRTHLMALTTRHPSLSVCVKGIQAAEMTGRCAVELALTNLTDQALRLQAGAGTLSSAAQAVTLAPGQTRELALSTTVVGSGSQVVPFTLREEGGARVLWAGETEMRTSFLGYPYYGQALPGLEGLSVWWCESGWKVGRERPAPRPSNEAPRPVSVTAARGEYEAAQVVLSPARDGQLLAAQVDWEQPASAAASIRTELCEVAYMYVAQPTDETCVRGWYPDPLPPLQTPLALRAGMNQPLWITFQVPRAAAPGQHRGTLKLETSFGRLELPVTVGVYDFELPRATHLRSSLGLSPQTINQYHRLTQPEDQRLVYEKYLRNFAEHRISPYHFQAYSPIGVRFVGEGTNKQARLDFAAFDAAAGKWLDEYGFTSFQLGLRGMGGGTFHSRHLGELEGFKEGTPEHARLFGDYLGQIERHLREKGWLDRAFAYWFDEPDPKDYEFVVAGMKRLKAAAPGLKRLLTEQPEPALVGHVDIWCALTPEWTREKVRARQAAGEEVWWYICTGPKAPYVTEFIDHPGTELRLWPWQSWQYGVSGLLVWETVYWTSPLAYPRPKRQDPWSDPMSWVSGYGNPVGFKSPWGNGDGRFLYPPPPARQGKSGDAEPLLEGPVSSVRWENLRDGLEDYEYLWLLRELAKDTASADVLGEARKLLEVPADISRDLTHFTTDPRDILAHRERLARLIERLTKRR